MCTGTADAAEALRRPSRSDRMPAPIAISALRTRTALRALPVNASAEPGPTVAGPASGARTPLPKTSAPTRGRRVADVADGRGAADAVGVDVVVGDVVVVDDVVVGGTSELVLFAFQRPNLVELRRSEVAQLL